jgi:hypothetical protein
MTPLNHQTALFELVPVDIIGNILDQLNRVTGSKGIINDADLPVVMRYARSLACTSKTMASNVHHPDVTDLFLESLSHKYGESNEHLAALLNTTGARQWIWNYIKKKGDDKAYQVIQEIYELASDVLKEAKHAGLKFEYSEGRKGWPGPNPLYYQTKQGFALYIDHSPSHLATPFGQITIYGDGVSSGNSLLSITEVFIRRLNAVFQHMVGTNSLGIGGNEQIYEIAASSGQDTIRKISEKEIKQISIEELRNKTGTQNLITTKQYGNCTVYTIREVKGKKAPDLIVHDAKNSIRSIELITRIWEMLEANRLGQDPIAKKIEPQQVVSRSESVKNTLFNNISEISQWGIEWVIKLEQQDLFSGKTWITDKTKVLVMKHYNDARIIEILNSAAKQFLDKGSERSIHSFGYGNNCRFLNKKDLGHGIELWIREQSIPCDIHILKSAYDSVIKSMGQNWVRSELKNYPAILHTESEEDYILFVKQEKIVYEEDVFIRFLADPLDLSQSISCYGSWTDKSVSGIYLWIKKSHVEKTLAALNIRPLAQEVY